jgi:hypothetical protein
MKSHYDTRSAVVHGGSVLFKDRHRRLLKNQQDLRDFVRRLLVSYIRLTLSPEYSYDHDSLDSTLLHSTRRSELRVVMGLEKAP